jgi:signal transduction histidine kinase
LSHFILLVRPFLKITVLLTSSLLLAQSTALWTEHLAFWSRAELKTLRQRMQAIEAERLQLPESRLTQTSSRRGFQSSRVGDDEPLWVEVTLPEESLVDGVALIPLVVLKDDGSSTCFGFPLRHRIEVIDAAGRSQIVHESAVDLPNPDGYPVLQRITPVRALRIRVAVTKPWQRSELSVLALSEIMVFSGKRNLALGATVTASSSRQEPPAWSVENLTDHITPLGLPVLPGAPSIKGFHSALAKSSQDSKHVGIVLPRTVELDEITLVPMPRSEVPTWAAYGFPARFRLEVSASEDFSDPHTVADFQSSTFITPGANLVSFALRKQPVRAIRLTTFSMWQRSGDFLLALSEIIARSDGQNVALNAKAFASDQLDDPGYNPAALTDGSSNLGPLLDLPDWLSKLQRRQTLEREHVTLSAKLANLRARSQDQIVHGSIFVGVLVIGGFIWGIIHQRRVRHRDAGRLRERLARDLHDEIGSNLGSIALISAYASQDDASPESMRADLSEVLMIARESADSMRDMVRLISPRARSESEEWSAVVHGLARRLLRGIEMDIQLDAISPNLEIRRELYLFIKEVLHNIASHAQANHVRLHFSRANGRMIVDISDDGIGFDPSAPPTGCGLSNLRERAVSLSAALELDSAPGKGTRITLTLPA